MIFNSNTKMAIKGKKSSSVKKSAAKMRKRRTKVHHGGSSFEDIFRDLFGGAEPPETTASAFLKLSKEERLRESRRIITESVINAVGPPDPQLALAIAESEALLPGYATLDEPHREEIQKLIQHITTYLKDLTRKRPFNALMLAAPGAGKSHFIKQLASSMKSERVQAVTFNMATMRTADDIAQPIDEVRNIKVNDRFPLLFLDEFDSDPSRYSALLPLLWDGELHLGHRDLRLGKAVIVLAGSNPDLPEAMAQSAKMRLDGSSNEALTSPGKLIDLLSRINGGTINIPDLDLQSADRDRRVDKVCIAVALLKLRFGQDLAQVPRALLRFIAQTRFRYGVRSIAHLIDVIDVKAAKDKSVNAETMNLPFDDEKVLQASSLSLHLLDESEAFGIVSRWRQCCKDKTSLNIRESLLPRLITADSAWRPKP